MKRFRIGNDIRVIWDVLKNGNAVNLSGKTISLFMTHPRGREEIKSYSLAGTNRIEFTLEGLSQTVLGKYTLTIDIRENGRRVLIQDKCGAFELVGRSCVENAEETNYTVEL